MFLNINVRRPVVLFMIMNITFHC